MTEEDLFPENAASSPGDVRQVYWIEHDVEGRVLRAGMCQPQTAHLHLPLEEGAAMIWSIEDPGVWLNRDEFHVDGGSLRRRVAPPIVVSKNEIAADDADGAYLSGIPEGAVAAVDGRPIGDLEDGTLVLTSAMPATYHVRIEAWPFLPFEVEITAR